MKLPGPFSADKKSVNAVIETPRGSRNKYGFDPGSQLFLLKKTLPTGCVFPFAFGFIPGTKGEDGDPLDILVIIEEPVFPGCLIEARLLGIIEASQQEKKGKPKRNDRLLAVPAVAREYDSLQSISDIDKNRMEELLQFFTYYNQIEGKKFAVLGLKGPKAAMNAIKKHKS